MRMLATPAARCETEMMQQINPSSVPLLRKRIAIRALSPLLS